MIQDRSLLWPRHPRQILHKINEVLGKEEHLNYSRTEVERRIVNSLAMSMKKATLFENDLDRERYLELFCEKLVPAYFDSSPCANSKLLSDALKRLWELLPWDFYTYRGNKLPLIIVFKAILEKVQTIEDRETEEVVCSIICGYTLTLPDLMRESSLYETVSVPKFMDTFVNGEIPQDIPGKLLDPIFCREIDLAAKLPFFTPIGHGWATSNAPLIAICDRVEKAQEKRRLVLPTLRLLLHHEQDLYQDQAHNTAFMVWRILCNTNKRYREFNNGLQMLIVAMRTSDKIVTEGSWEIWADELFSRISSSSVDDPVGNCCAIKLLKGMVTPMSPPPKQQLLRKVVLNLLDVGLEESCNETCIIGSRKKKERALEAVLALQSLFHLSLSKEVKSLVLDRMMENQHQQVDRYLTRLAIYSLDNHSNIPHKPTQ